MASGNSEAPPELSKISYHVIIKPLQRLLFSFSRSAIAIIIVRHLCRLRKTSEDEEETNE